MTSAPTLPSDVLDTLAQQLLQARKDQQWLTSGTLPGLTEADAYAIQQRVSAQLWEQQGQRTGAWKSGTGSIDVTPTVAPIWPARVFPTGATLSMTDYQLIGAEAEIAYRLGSDLPLRDGDYSEEELRAAIDAAHVVIETIDSRLQDWQSPAPFWGLADNAVNGAFVIGTEVSDWQALNLPAQTVEVWINDELKISKTGSHALGEPWLLMPWTLNHLIRRQQGLRKGDIITTGSWMGSLQVKAGDSVRVNFPGIGEATMQISA